MTERDRERLLGAPLRLGVRLLERLVRERESDFRRLRGERDKEGDLRPPRLGDRDAFLLGEGLLRRFGETEWELLRLLGDLDFLGDFDTFFFKGTDGEVDRDRRLAPF